MSVANLVSGDITHLAMLFSRSHRRHLTFPHIHTRGQQYEDHPTEYSFYFILFFTYPFFCRNLVLIMIMEVDRVGSILLPKNPTNLMRFLRSIL